MAYLVTTVVREAVRHSAEHIAVPMHAHAGVWRLVVTDDGKREPVTVADRHRVVGAPLADVLDRLAEDWGVEIRATSGKDVWLMVCP